jgi:heterodisulfide reductase subunit C/nitrate reductase gamma subunit
MSANQLAFIGFTILSVGIFSYTCIKIWKALKVTRSDDWPRLNQIGQRIYITLLVAFGQQKMFKRPVAGILHALVWWGFLVITIGTIEIIIDGITGYTRVFSALGPIYDVIMASGEIFALLVILACLVFLYRRLFIHIPRFKGVEMTRASHWDAIFDLVLILLLMASLIGMNLGYIQSHSQHYAGAFPLSDLLAQMQLPSLLAMDMHLFESINWWIHIGLVYFFLNYLPYSKHFHIIVAVPNVFLSRLSPKGEVKNMVSIKREIELLMNPDAGGEEEPPPERFGVKDAEDVAWKTLLDAYTCTECGRCTAVCPANRTGKVLSPRKLFVDLRKRMDDKAAGLIKEGEDFSDGEALVGDYISEEELWACTTCMACIEECPVNIDHVPFIINMRRNLVMEETKTSRELNEMFQNIETNGAPWPYSQEDRLKWADDVEFQTMADLQEKGEEPDREEPLILREGDTVEDAMKELPGDMKDRFKHARVTGESSKFPEQKVGMEHELMDEDVLEFNLRHI